MFGFHLIRLIMCLIIFYMMNDTQNGHTEREYYRIYSNGEETFTRTRPTYGDTGKYDVERATEADLDNWLEANGFELIGYDTID